MKSNFTKTSIFSCPIYKIRIDPNSYDKEKIINDIKYNKGLKNTRNVNANFDNCDIHHSYQDFHNKDLILMSATGILIRYNIKDSNIKPQIINSNFNKFTIYFI